MRSFAAAVAERLGDTPIDALVLNAGRSGNADELRADGYETTFAVNHLAHYLLLRLLLQRLADHARLVLTTSSTHDPAQRTPLPPPRHADAHLLAHPELDPDRTDGQAPPEGAPRLQAVRRPATARALAAIRRPGPPFHRRRLRPGPNPRHRAAAQPRAGAACPGRSWDHRRCGHWCPAPTAVRQPAVPWPSWP